MKLINYSNGKLLLTGEYLVLDGAKALAVPVKFGQSLEIQKINNLQLIWKSYNNNYKCWFAATFNLAELSLKEITYSFQKKIYAEETAETLLNILKEAKKLNPSFLNSENGFKVKTRLTFPQNWGLGSSSTLINSVASWAKVDAFKLLWNSFGGSGYDIACAQNDKPIFYQIKNQKPIIKKIEINPSLKENLFFVFLNKKQSSKQEIERYRNNKSNYKKEIKIISSISEEIVKATSIKVFENLIYDHEQIISSIIKLEPVKENMFSDYFGAIKSLGAWGGDFILATGNEDTPRYFKSKGYNTIFNYTEIVL